MPRENTTRNIRGKGSDKDDRIHGNGDGYWSYELHLRTVLIDLQVREVRDEDIRRENGFATE